MSTKTPTPVFLNGRHVGWQQPQPTAAMWPGYGNMSFDDLPTEPPPAPKLALNERKCKKCKNRSLRCITLPDTGYPVAFCKLCGEHEEL